MLFLIVIAIVLGIGAGVITGLIPGLHVNLITVIAVSSVGVLSGISPLLVAIFIISLALTHSFLDSIPSIYLGAPDPDQVVAVLPGHQMFLEGKGHLAITYTLIGSLAALILCILFMPFGIKLLVSVQSFIQPYIGKILLGVILLLLVLSKKIILNSSFFLLAGLFGLLCFNIPDQRQILLPMLSGLFGTSTLLISLAGTSERIKQQFDKIIPITSKVIERTVSRATLVGILASFLPGFGSSQAAIVASSTMRKKTAIDYLLLVGGINTVNFAFSLVTVTLLGKARNGAIVGVKDLLGEITIHHLLLFIPVLLIVGGIATLLGLWLSKRTANILQKMPYKKVVIGVLVFLFVMVVSFSWLKGILILLTATGLGIVASRFGAQKNMLLGCLLLPVIVYLW